MADAATVWRINTDMGSFDVSFDRPVTQEEAHVAASARLRGAAGFDKEPALGASPVGPSPNKAAQPVQPPTLGSTAKALMEGAPGAGGEPASVGRTATRIGGAALGAAGGGALGGPPGAVLGAGTGAAGADVLFDYLSGTPRTTGERVMNAGRNFTFGSGGEVGGQGAVSAAAPLMRYLGLSKSLTPEASVLVERADRFGIPLSASDITGSRAVAKLENLPTHFAIGSGAPQRFATNKLQAAGSATKGLIGETPDAMTAGLAAKESAKDALGQFRLSNAANFERVNQAAGDAPVISLDNLRTVLEPILESSGQRPLGATAGMRRLSEITGGAIPNVNVGGSAFKDLPPALQQTIRTAMEQGDGKIPFQLARQIEAELGQLAYKNRPIGTITEGQYKALHGAIKRDLDTFLLAPEHGMTNTALAEAKQAYRTGRAQFDTGSINKWVLDKGTDPEQVAGRVFRPGAVTDTLDFRQTVSPEAFDKVAGAWLAGIYDKALTTKTTSAAGERMFSPGRFVSQVQPYIENGQLAMIVGPEKAEKFKDLMSVLQRMGRAEGLAGNPSGTGGALISTHQFHQIASAALGVGGALAGSTAGLGAIPGALGSILMPWLAGKVTTSPTGIRLLTEGFSGRYSAPALRFATQALSQSANEATKK